MLQRQTNTDADLFVSRHECSSTCWARSLIKRYRLRRIQTRTLYIHITLLYYSPNHNNYYSTNQCCPVLPSKGRWVISLSGQMLKKLQWNLAKSMQIVFRCSTPVSTWILSQPAHCVTAEHLEMECVNY